MMVTRLLCGPRVALAVFVWVALVTATAAAGRIWRDNTGGFTVRAELVKVDGGVVRLRTDAGKEISVPLKRLSNADRKFLRQQAQTLTLPNLRKIVAEYLRPIPPRLTAAQREKAAADKQQSLPVGKGFRLQAKVLDIVAAEDNGSYEITLVYESPRKMKYQEMLGGDGFRVVTGSRTRPVERIEIRARGGEALLDYEKDQALTITGIIEKMKVDGAARPRWFDVRIEGGELIISTKKRGR